MCASIRPTPGLREADMGLAKSKSSVKRAQSSENSSEFINRQVRYECQIIPTEPTPADVVLANEALWLPPPMTPPGPPTPVLES